MIIRTAIFHGGDLDGQTRGVAFDDSGKRILDEATGRPYARDDSCKCGRDYEIHFRAANRPQYEVGTLSSPAASDHLVKMPNSLYCCQQFRAAIAETTIDVSDDGYDIWEINDLGHKHTPIAFCPFCGTRLQIQSPEELIKRVDAFIAAEGDSQ